ncbi:MAG: glycosyl hydrolase 53 family protein, partial [Bacteroidota bacterium]
MKNLRHLSEIWMLLVLISCNQDQPNLPVNYEGISAVDISSYPEISKSAHLYFDLEGNQKPFLDILKENGINTIRLRIWVDPKNEHSGFAEVKAFSETLKAKGFKLWLTLHYSDTWADPGRQNIPHQWQG